MGSCGCSTTKGSATIKDRDMQSDDVEWTGGTFAAGATLNLINARPRMPLAGIKVPNILMFSENPCIEAGQSIIVENTESANCMKGFSNCLTATAPATLVAGFWEVVTNGGWSSLGGATTLSFTTITSSLLCDPSVGSSIKAPEVLICGVPPIVSDYSGFVYSRPLNSPPSNGTVYAVNGATIVKAKNGFRPLPGDSIELSQSSLVGANAAVVQYVSQAKSDEGIVTLIGLDRPVTGLTATAPAGQTPCSDAISKPRKIANLTFSLICGCRITATLPASVSSLPTFPQGKSDGYGDCEEQAYCFQINRSTIGLPANVASGRIYLK